MRSFNPTFGDRYGYYLFHERTNETKHIADPIGFSDDHEVISRDTSMDGIIRKTSDDLEFYQGKDHGDFNNDGGYDFIDKIKSYGIKERVWLVKTYKDNVTSEIKEEYRSFLDLVTSVKRKDNNKNFYSVKSKSTGIDTILKSRKSEQVEIDRDTTLDGATIPYDIPYDRVKIKGRDIQLIYYQRESDEQVDFTGNQFHIKTDIVYTSDDSFSAVTGNTGVSSQFFIDSDRDYNSVTVSISYKVRLDFIPSETNYSLILEHIYGDEGFETTTNYTLDSGLALVAGIIKGDVSQFIPNLTEKSNLRAYFSLSYTGDNQTASKSVSPVYFDLKMEAVDSYASTYCRAYKVKDVYNRLMYIYNGKDNLVESSFLDTIGDMMYITDGGLIRNIPTEAVDLEQKEWHLSTSLSELMQSMDATWFLGSGIKRVGRKETMIVEPRNYFYSDFVSLCLGNVYDVEYSFDEDKFYSEINIGYEDGVSIEDIHGLDKANGLVNRPTVITETDNVYSKISPYQIDDYLIEQLRRQQYSIDPTTDNDNDNVKFFLDCKEENGEIVQRDYTDDLVGLPENVFNPSQMKGCRWTPLACFLRHGKWIKGGLTDYLNKRIAFGSSKDKTQLKTAIREDLGYKYLSERVVSERDPIFAFHLDREMFYPEIITFTKTVTRDHLDVLRSYTNGVQNYYGLIEFVDEDGEIRKGYLMELKPEGKGEWTLLSYRKKPVTKPSAYNSRYGLGYE